MSEPHLGHDHRCQDFLERLSRYLDDELSASDHRTIERHLRDCPCCEDVLDSLKQTVALCHDEGRPELPANVRQRARARVAELLQRAPARRARVR
jgi:anti-sigma factor RsiW